MSSANRGRARNKDDLYETPYWLIEAEIPRITHMIRGIDKPRIWEPCAGNGRITRVLKHFFPNADIHSTDIGSFAGLDECGIDFLEQGHYDKPWDLILSNPPFFIAEPIIKHAQTLVTRNGSVLMLERLNFFGTKKREPWLAWDVPNSDISPRRASFLPTGQCDSIEYTWLEFQSAEQSMINPKSYGRNTLLPTMLCWGCGDHQYHKTCNSCDYGYCETCLPDHGHNECQRNLFGKESLWYCYNHPDRPMTNACRAKGCSLPFCDECWTEHASHKWRACMVEEEEGFDA